MMAKDAEVAPSFQPLLGVGCSFFGSHESQVADPVIEARQGNERNPVLAVTQLRNLW